MSFFKSWSDITRTFSEAYELLLMSETEKK
jgi:hypothetical protein